MLTRQFHLILSFLCSKKKQIAKFHTKIIKKSTCSVGGCLKLFSSVSSKLLLWMFLSKDIDLVKVFSMLLLLLMNMLSRVVTFSLPVSACRLQTVVVRTDSITNIARRFVIPTLWHNIFWKAGGKLFCFFGGCWSVCSAVGVVEQ